MLPLGLINSLLLRSNGVALVEPEEQMSHLCIKWMKVAAPGAATARNSTACQIEILEPQGHFINYF